MRPALSLPSSQVSPRAWRTSPVRSLRNSLTTSPPSLTNSTPLRARRGLRRLNIDKDVIDEYMSIIEGRAERKANGATWQLRMLDRLAPGSRKNTRERDEGLKAMMDAYLTNQESGRPVHTWDVPA